MQLSMAAKVSEALMLVLRKFFFQQPDFEAKKTYGCFELRWAFSLDGGCWSRAQCAKYKQPIHRMESES